MSVECKLNEITKVLDSKYDKSNPKGYISGVNWGKIGGNIRWQVDLLNLINSEINSFGISLNDIAHWNEAYSWGDHGLAGYATEAWVNSQGFGSSNFNPTNLFFDYGFVDNSTDWNTAFSWGNHANAGYLTSGSLSGYATQSWVNSQGFVTGTPWTALGYLTELTANTLYSAISHTHTFASITSKPTTLTGYGITDAYPLTGNPSGFVTGTPWTALGYLTSASADLLYSALGHTHTFASLTSKPTTIAGYGISDYDSLWDTRLGTKSTTNLLEGTNLYYTNARGIGSTLTGYTSGAGTISSADTILSAIQKLNGNIIAGGSMTYPSVGIAVSTGSAWATSIVDNSSNWNTAYAWGDHSAVGYLTSFSEIDPIYTASTWYSTTNNSSNWNTAFSWGDHAGLYSLASHTHTFASLTSKPTTVAGYSISDAMTTAHAANSISGTNITNWDSAFGWGNHASAGYELASNKGIAGGYTALVGQRIKITSFVDNTTIGLIQYGGVTTARVWTLQDRTDTLADLTDIATKQDTLVSATNIKTVNGASILGSGDLIVTGSGASMADVIAMAIALG